MSTYILWHSDDIQVAVMTAISNAKSSISVEHLCKNLGVAKEVILAIIGGGINNNHDLIAKEVNGIIYLDPPIAKVKNTHLLDYKRAYTGSVINLTRIKYHPGDLVFQTYSTNDENE
ncbi:unnamed protein product [Calypogeia fissa]